MLRTLIAGLLILTVTSCTTWRPVPIDPEGYIRTHNPEFIWAQLADSSTLTLKRPTVVLDTLRGISGGAYRRIPLSSVVRLRAEEPDGSKTAAVVAVSVAATALFVYWVATSDKVQP